MIKTKVVNIRHQSCDVYIGRPSKWGNPFQIGRDGSREEVIERYREWFSSQFHLQQQLVELRGKILGCFCKPLCCHGDVLVEYVEKRYGGR